MFMLSPGVNINEVDLTAIVPAVSTTDMAIGGVFQWGSCNEAKLVSSENELVTRYGKPTSENFETFYSAANALAYGNKLYVSRAIDENAKNATAGKNVLATDTVTILNQKDFDIKETTLPDSVFFAAKYPSKRYGNSLKISICDSANAYKSNIGVDSDSTNDFSLSISTNSDTATLKISNDIDDDASVASDLEAVTDKMNPGDYLEIGSKDIGFQMMKIKNIETDGANSGSVTATIKFYTRFYLIEDVEMSSFNRYWEFYETVAKAPNTSFYAREREIEGDELHIVITDRLGVFTGTPNSILEVWENLSRATDAKGEQGGTIYYKDVLNRSSLYVWAASNTKADAPVGEVSEIEPVTTLPLTLEFSNGVDSASENSMPLSALARAYDVYKSSQDIDISVIITGKSIGGAHGEGLANYIIDNIQSKRKDCVVTVSPQLEDTVNNPFQERESIIEFFDSVRYSSYAIADTGHKQQYDRYNDVYRWVPLSGDIAGTIVYTDMVRDPWVSPAGFTRGNIKNIVKLAYNPNEADRDILYKANINPVVTFAGSGTVLYGDKTHLGKPSAFDRINVRRLFITMEKAIAIAAKSYLFEFNNEFTRANFKNLIEPYLRDVKGREGITDFKVICDETNNTGEVIDRNEFIGDIYIKPSRSINFIQLNFIAVKTAVNFDEIIKNA